MIHIENTKPNNFLLKYVKKISIFESKGKIKFRQKLTPSAFTYLSYNHEEIPTSIFGKKRVHPKQRLQLAGPKIDEDIYVEYDGKLKQILMEFTASGFYYLFHESPSKIVNSLRSLDNIPFLKNNMQPEKELESAGDVKKQIEILEKFLIEIAITALQPCSYLEDSLKLIEDKNGNVQIKEIAEQVNVSERQLNRKFLEIVGVTPKQYSKIIQLHYVINIMSSKKYSSLQDIAYFADYYDLPHFSRGFKELTGFSPKEFLTSDKHIALKFFNDLIVKK